MIYRWALFRNKNKHVGLIIEIITILIAIAAITLPLISESLLTLKICFGLCVICFVLFFIFSKGDKLRQSMHG
jgi:uncharacterized membrane protein YfcA